MAPKSKVTPLSSVTRSGGSSESVADIPQENLTPIQWTRLEPLYWQKLGYKMTAQEIALYVQLYCLCIQGFGALDRDLERVAREIPGGRNTGQTLRKIRGLIDKYPELFILTDCEFCVKDAKVEALRAISVKRTNSSNSTDGWEKRRRSSATQRNQGGDDATA